MQLSLAIIDGLNAYYPENYIPFEDMHKTCTVNPEKLTIQKDMFEKILSSKAQLTINEIILTPEVFETKIRGDISWTQVRNHMRTQHNFSWREINKIRKEIQIWLHEQD